MFRGVIGYSTETFSSADVTRKTYLLIVLPPVHPSVLVNRPMRLSDADQILTNCLHNYSSCETSLLFSYLHR